MALSGIQQSKLDKIRAIIKKELLECNESVTPSICRMRSTKKGYAELEKMIIERCLKHKETPYQVIGQLESELAE